MSINRYYFASISIKKSNNVILVSVLVPHGRIIWSVMATMKLLGKSFLGDDQVLGIMFSIEVQDKDRRVHLIVYCAVEFGVGVVEVSF